MAENNQSEKKEDWGIWKGIFYILVVFVGVFIFNLVT